MAAERADPPFYSQTATDDVPLRDRGVSDEDTDDEAAKSQSNRAPTGGWRYPWLYETASTLRVLGLQLFVLPFRKLYGINVETPKVAVRKSRVSALLRALVHLVPIGASLALVILNLKHLYLGATVANVSYLQFAAKAHEIFIQASLTYIVANEIGRQLTRPSGLPFGLIFSPAKVTDVTFLWSSAFAGSFRRPGKGFLTLIMVATAIIIATGAGPSSAILMIPRVDRWPAGSTRFWINATAQELWPDKLDASNLIDPDSCRRIEDPLLSNDCPGSEYGQLRSYFLLQNHTNVQSNYQKYYETYLTGSPGASGSAQVTGKNSLRPLSLMNPKFMNIQSAAYAPGLSTYATAPHAAVTDALVSMADLWVLALGEAMQMVKLEPSVQIGTLYVASDQTHDVSVSSNQLVFHTLDTGIDQPYTTSWCMRAYTDTANLSQPAAVPSGFGPSTDWKAADKTATYISLYDRNLEYLQVPNTTWSDIFSAPGDNQTDYRVSWLSLDVNAQSTTADKSSIYSLWAFVLAPRPQNTTRLDFSLCPANAGWAKTILNVTSDGQGPNRVTSAVVPVNKSLHSKGYSWFTHKTYEGMFSLTNQDFSYPVFPQRPITLSQSWLDLLNPIVPSAENKTHNSSVFNELVRAAGGVQNDTYTFAAAISAMLANGVSRAGFSASLTGTVAVEPDSNILSPKWLKENTDVLSIDPKYSDGYTVFKKRTFVVGYSFQLRGTPSILAIVVLLAYCVLAIGYTLYTIWSGLCADSWTSVMEITALSMNSPPPDALRNTGAGISGMAVYGKQAMIRAMANGTESGGSEDNFGKEDRDPTGNERLALVVNSGLRSEEVDSLGEPVVANREYG
ncbi:hypothetical protein BBP40_001353 [Aspergillus hancockii]|nr:hypothetical protein BBP40_001353 [Aspergillus hancockii]